MNSSRASHHRRHRNSPIAAILRQKNSAVAGGLSSPVNFRQGFSMKGLSARKLAAGLWKLRFMELSGDASLLCSSTSELANENVSIILPTHQKARKKQERTKQLPWRPLTILRSRNGNRCELESSMPCLKCCKGDATRWDTAISALLEELLQAQRCINKLKAARKCSKKKIQQFVHKFEEEKKVWKHREFQKIQATLDDIKDKLGRERRSRERMELMNSELVHELAEANRCGKHMTKNYEEEKRRRELMEQVCNELAMQIGEDKARLEELETESMRIREEVEEERRMMQMAEMWREERIQMKLVDARLALEEKYDQMIKLVSNYLQAFLRSRGGDGELDKIKDILKDSYDFSIRKEEEDNEDGLEVDNVQQEDNIIGNEVMKIFSGSRGELKRKAFSSSSSSSYSNGVFSPGESEAVNPHVTRGMKGFIEWPRGIPKSNSKAMSLSLDERMRSQKLQLQHILKPKA